MKDFFQNKKTIAALVLVLCSNFVWAAEEAAVAVSPEVGQFKDTMLWLFLGSVTALLLGAVYMVSTTMKLYRDLLSEAYAKEHGITLKPVIVEKAKDNIFSKIWYQLTGTGAVAIEREADIMLAHPHDGIYELDNKLPPWWVNMFYITIVFAVAYIGYFHFYQDGERGQLYEYKEAMKEGEVLKALAADRDANSVNETNVVASTKPTDLDAGKAIFIEKCAACHGQKGEGGVGPNMTDEYWLHGGSIKNVFGVVKNGVPAKGMIAWKDQLRPAQIQAVSSYILTLKGTNPPNAKAPQGEKYQEVVDAAAPQ
jgi:cytochrome c oxidase cbb3-type subunit III